MEGKSRCCLSCREPCSGRYFKQGGGTSNEGNCLSISVVNNDITVTKCCLKKFSSKSDDFVQQSRNKDGSPEYSTVIRCPQNRLCCKCDAIVKKVSRLVGAIKSIEKSHVVPECLGCKRPNFLGRCKRCEYLIHKYVTSNDEEPQFRGRRQSREVTRSGQGQKIAIDQRQDAEVSQRKILAERTPPDRKGIGLRQGLGVSQGKGLAEGTGPGQVIRIGQRPSSGVGQESGFAEETGPDQEIGIGQRHDRGTGKEMELGIGLSQEIRQGQRQGQRIDEGIGSGQEISLGKIQGKGVGQRVGIGEVIRLGQGIGQDQRQRREDYFNSLVLKVNEKLRGVLQCDNVGKHRQQDDTTSLDELEALLTEISARTTQRQPRISYFPDIDSDYFVSLQSLIHSKELLLDLLSKIEKGSKTHPSADSISETSSCLCKNLKKHKLGKGLILPEITSQDNILRQKKSKRSSLKLLKSERPSKEEKESKDRKSLKDIRLSKEEKESKDRKSSKDIRLLKEEKELKDRKSSKDIRLSKEEKESKDRKSSKDIRLLKEEKESKDRKSSKDIRLSKEEKESKDRKSSKHRKSSKDKRLSKKESELKDRKSSKDDKLSNEKTKSKDRRSSKDDTISKEGMESRNRKYSKEEELSKEMKKSKNGKTLKDEKLSKEQKQSQESKSRREGEKYESERKSLKEEKESKSNRGEKGRESSREVKALKSKAEKSSNGESQSTWNEKGRKASKEEKPSTLTKDGKARNKGLRMPSKVTGLRSSLQEEKSQKSEKPIVYNLPAMLELPIKKESQLQRVSSQKLSRIRSESTVECEVYVDDPNEMIKGTDVVSFEPHYKEAPPAQPDTIMETAFSTAKMTKLPSIRLPSKKRGLSMENAKKGVIKYALSDRQFIDKGWTVLPTEKMMRRMNIYKMEPTSKGNNWFERHKYKKIMFYDSGEKLAEIDDDGTGRWYYKNGIVALNYYNSEDLNASQRYLVYSSGEESINGRNVPISVMAAFDYIGNGVVYDYFGNERLKYNQSEGSVIDSKIGPPSRWHWHSLNNPPILQPVFIDTLVKTPDPDIEKLMISAGGRNLSKESQEDMLAIEFDNFVKEKADKLLQKYKPFEIRMKAVKINNQFSLRVINQANIYLMFREGTTCMKLNIGMVLKNDEIVDTESSDVSYVSTPYDQAPPRTRSLAEIQGTLSQARKIGKIREHRQALLKQC